MIPHKNRIPQKAGRVNLEPIAGEENKYILTRADDPLETGTPLNKEMLDEFLAASGTTTGSAAALELAQDGFVLGDGYVVRFKLNVEINDSNGTTLNINKTGAKPLKLVGGYPYGTIQRGTWVTAIYDAEEDAYIMAGSAEIINYAVGEIDKADYIPFFDSSLSKNSRVLLSEFLKTTTRATGYKKEIARFTTSGNWVCPNDVTEIDVWLVGGGGGGGIYYGGGGGGGYCLFAEKVAVTAGTSYAIVIGAGGVAQTDGGTTTAFNKTAEGGKAGGTNTTSSGKNGKGGDGGNGGGGGSNTVDVGGDGGCQGGSGRYGGSTGGLGSRSRVTSSNPKGERGTVNPYDGKDYAGGGGGAGSSSGGNGGGFCGGAPAEYGTTQIGGWAGGNNQNGGGGGGYYGGGGGGTSSQSVVSTYGSGMSGIVIIYA